MLDVGAKFKVTVLAWMYRARLQGCWFENKSKIDVWYGILITDLTLLQIPVSGYVLL